jgi:mitochondrial import receptor subunit TOM40
MGGGLMFGCNYFQSITPTLQMGGEGMYIAANQNLLSNYTLKYTMPAKSGEEEDTVVELPKKTDPRMPVETPSSTLYANFTTGQSVLTLNYKRVVTPNRVTLGAELQFSALNWDSNVLVGAEFKLSRSKVQFCVDGSGRLQSTLEAKLGQGHGAPTLSFAAEMDHPKDVMRFGYGLNIEG